MTSNQLILLLDVRRGFSREGHTGTLNKDIEYLKGWGLIEVGVSPLTVDGFRYRLTEDGEKVCDSILKEARGAIELQRVRLTAREVVGRKEAE